MLTKEKWLSVVNISMAAALWDSLPAAQKNNIYTESLLDSMERARNSWGGQSSYRAAMIARMKRRERKRRGNEEMDTWEVLSASFRAARPFSMVK